MKSVLTVTEKRFVHIMQLLGDATRYKIFKILQSEREFCVSEIASELEISPSAVSQHFKSFEMLGLVDKHRYGQKICYALKNDDEIINEFKKITKEELVS